ncbi:MAG: hypothetical protein ACI82Z_000546 [Cellvibrionaceae bacterium]|jgi:hypothetical protein
MSETIFKPRSFAETLMMLCQAYGEPYYKDGMIVEIALAEKSGIKKNKISRWLKAPLENIEKNDIEVFAKIFNVMPGQLRGEEPIELLDGIKNDRIKNEIGTDVTESFENQSDDSDKSTETQNKKSEIQIIREELQTLNKHKFVRIQNSTLRMLWTSFLKGVAVGLGSVLGATIVVSILLALLAQIEFIPIIGDWAEQLMREVQQYQPP